MIEFTSSVLYIPLAMRINLLRVNDNVVVSVTLLILLRRDLPVQ